MRLGTVLTLLSITSITLHASDSEACGGFFCSQNNPINQNTEQVIFSVNGDGTTTAVVQILYSGPANRFAWVVPVPSAPEIGISSNIAFQRLVGRTNPSFNLRRNVVGRCRQPTGGGGGGDASASFSDAGVGAVDAGAPPVNVVDEGQVGPFDFAVLQVLEGTPNPEDAALDWLAENNYDVSSVGRGLLRSYLENNMLLVAFRLTSDRPTGDIRPITMTYTSTQPMLPIRLTAVAVAPNMPIRIWVLGPNRAVPLNYRSVEVNQALINWSGFGRDYPSLLTQAADEAGGRAFATEFAQSARQIDEVVFRSGDQLAYNQLLSLEGELSDTELLNEVITQFQGWDGVPGVVREHVNPPMGNTIRDVLRCPRCVFRAGTIPKFNRQAFLSSLDTMVIQPVRATQALFDARAYVTRLDTTMSANEMTLDPVFDFNPDLPDVSNIHTAIQTVFCDANVEFWNAPFSVEFDDGTSFRSRGSRWPSSLSGLPAAVRIFQYTTSGPGTKLRDNSAFIGRRLAELDVPAPADAGFPMPPVQPDGGSPEPPIEEPDGGTPTNPGNGNNNNNNGGMNPATGSGDEIPRVDQPVEPRGCTCEATEAPTSEFAIYLAVFAVAFISLRPRRRTPTRS